MLSVFGKDTEKQQRELLFIAGILGFLSILLGWGFFASSMR